MNKKYILIPLAAVLVAGLGALALRSGSGKTLPVPVSASQPAALVLAQEPLQVFYLLSCLTEFGARERAAAQASLFSAGEEEAGIGVEFFYDLAAGDLRFSVPLVTGGNSAELRFETQELGFKPILGISHASIVFCAAFFCKRFLLVLERRPVVFLLFFLRIAPARRRSIEQ